MASEPGGVRRLVCSKPANSRSTSRFQHAQNCNPRNMASRLVSSWCTILLVCCKLQKIGTWFGDDYLEAQEGSYKLTFWLPY